MDLQFFDYSKSICTASQTRTAKFLSPDTKNLPSREYVMSYMWPIPDISFNSSPSPLSASRTPLPHSRQSLYRHVNKQDGQFRYKWALRREYANIATPDSFHPDFCTYLEQDTITYSSSIVSFFCKPQPKY